VNSKNAMIIAALFLAFGIVGAMDFSDERMSELERENNSLRAYAQRTVCIEPEYFADETVAAK
jgi:hypothetical protein